VIIVKYRAIDDFHEYYSGARVALYLTLFVGDNHEANAHKNKKTSKKKDSYKYNNAILV